MPDKRVLCLAMRAAFPKTLPILAAFLFLGITYGVYMHASGFSFWYPMLIGATVFAGSMEFVAVNLLLGAFSPLQALGLTLMVNARHLFYGLSMLEKYRGMGVKKPYLMFQLLGPRSRGRGQGLVLLFRDPVQPDILGLGGDTRGALWLLHTL